MNPAVNVPTGYDEFATFDEAAQAVLHMMRELLTLDLWLVSRVHDDEWIVLNKYGEGDLSVGDVLPLDATICRELLAGHGPNIAPALSDEPAYCRAPVVDAKGIASYAGAPLVVKGSLFGVLCGMSTTPRPQKLEEQTPHLITAARSLSTILGQELRNETLARRVERAENDALMDGLTGLYNRRGWDRLVALEAARARRYGHKSVVVIMDVDGLKSVNDTGGHAAGDALLVHVAEAIRSVIREHDIAARIGGDEFALLATETANVEAEALVDRLSKAFRSYGVSVSLGVSHVGLLDIADATRNADEAMYRRKAERRLHERHDAGRSAMG